MCPFAVCCMACMSEQIDSLSGCGRQWPTLPCCYWPALISACEAETGHPLTKHCQSQAKLGAFSRQAMERAGPLHWCFLHRRQLYNMSTGWYCRNSFLYEVLRAKFWGSCVKWLVGKAEAVLHHSVVSSMKTLLPPESVTDTIFSIQVSFFGRH